MSLSHLTLVTVMFFFIYLLSSLAEPMDDLQKSYEQFLGRMEKKKNKQVQVMPSGYGVFLPEFLCCFLTFIDII